MDLLCSRSPLALAMFPEMTRSAAFPPPPPRVVLMPFTMNDSFDDFARERKLPDCAASFLSRAGTWSASASKSGFVPSTMHAEFSSDPDQAVRVLLAARAVRRVKAGVRITESPHWVLVNARDVTRDAEREEAEAERRREYERTRKQRQRERERAAREARMSAGVTGTSREATADVPAENRGKRKKPQVNGANVPRDISGTSRGTGTPSRARARPDDFDFDQSAGVSQSRSDARASDADDPELVAVVASVICAEASFLPGDDQARAVIRIYEDRARKAGTVIRDKPAYYAGSVRKEPDLWNGILLPKPLPAAELRPPAPAPGSWADPYGPRPDPDRPHGFDPPNRGAVCWCGSTENSPRHYGARRECPA